MTPSLPPSSRPAGAARRSRRALAAVALAAVLVGTGCGEDAVSNGVAPEGDGAPPQDPQPQDNEQEAPNAEDPDLTGDEEPGMQQGGEESGEEQD